MIKAIFYKEWIKSRSLILLLLSLSAAQVIYFFINNANLLRTSGAIAVWAQIAEGGLSLYSPIFKLFMPLAALAISAMQYSFEMANKRFKLTLHLPYREAKIVGAMQLFGVSIIGLLFIVMLTPTLLGLFAQYPREIVGIMALSLAPYILGSFACYFFVMWVIIEPIWSRRVAYFFIAIAALSPFNISSTLGVSHCALLSFLTIVAASIAAAYYSASRFKDGAQK